MGNLYKVILADPPWQHSNYKDVAQGSPQYSTMPTEEICRIPTGKWAAKDCLLVLWTTWPFLEDAFKVVNSWGFNYVTGFPWIKTVPSSGEIRCGIGFWTQSVSEIILIARCGKVSPSKENKRRGLLVDENRQFYAPIRKHSQKPEDIQEWIENRYSGPYLELFARRKRPKWDCWGYDTGYILSSEGVHLISNPDLVS